MDLKENGQRNPKPGKEQGNRLGQELQDKVE